MRTSLPVLTASLLALALTACSREDTPAPAAKAPTLDTLTVGSGPAAREQQVDGALEAVNQATLSAQTSARITALPVDVNDRVQAGQLVARLRDTEQRSGLEQADGALRMAQARMVEADKTYARIKEVYEKRLVAAAQMDAATAEHDAARAALNAAQAARNRAAEQLAYTEVRAPFSGIVTTRPVQVGEAVMPGQPLLVVQAPGAMRAVVDITQQLAEALRKTGKATVLLGDGRRFEATQVTVFPNADPATQTVRVRADLPAKVNGDIYPGMAAKLVFSVGEAQTVAIPAASLVQRGEITGVYIQEADGHVAFRALRMGRVLADGRIEVLAGLAAGERVARDPRAAAAAVIPEGK
ncbi:MAG: efflux transporter periplasmic adaptor subunit [Moraxellaceae bacterium]|jgi:RND family efflux transporter MFP subunit|nr:efflux transporter periplasmic adaptor subunit [Moraxellaceae bacterium]